MKTETEIGRYEMKYVLPVSRHDEVLRLIATHVRHDPHGRPLGHGRHGYPVHSLYFDTADLADYTQRLDTRRIRNRLRVRTYGHAGEGQPVFLENKRKSGRWVVKQRARAGDADSWCRSTDPRPWTALTRAVSGRDRLAARQFCRLVDGGERFPVTVVHYLREVFVPRGFGPSRTRLTLDHEVSATIGPEVGSLFARPQIELIPAGWMVLELKFERQQPAWMRQLCRQLGILATPVSKFGIGIAKGLRADRPLELRYLTPTPLRRAGLDLAAETVPLVHLSVTAA